MRMYLESLRQGKDRGDSLVLASLVDLEIPACPAFQALPASLESRLVASDTNTASAALERPLLHKIDQHTHCMWAVACGQRTALSRIERAAPEDDC